MESGPARILFVTGKGGTGKSFLARSLARAAAFRGIPAALVHASASEAAGEVDGESADTATAAGVGAAAARAGGGDSGARNPLPLPYREIVLDEREALETFLVRILRIGFVARRLLDSRTFSAVAAAAPGVGDLVTLLGITALARAGKGLGLVIVDGPATGHSVPLLTAPSRILELAPIGPVAREARLAHSIVANPGRFVPVIVTTPEELAVTEALSLYDQLLAAGIATPRVVVNGVWPAHLQARDAQWLLTSGASADAALHWKRRRRQQELIEALQARVGPCRSLPFAFQEGETAPAAVAAVLTDILWGGVGEASRTPR